MQFSVPYYRALSTYRGWESSSKRDYSVVRMHFVSVPQRASNELFVGPPIAECTVPDGVTEDVSFERSVSVSTVQEVKAVREWVAEHQSFSEIASSISASVSLTGFTFDPKLTATLRDQYTERVRIEAGRTTTSTVTRTENVSVKIHVDGKIVAGDRTFIASNYREHVEVLYLTYIDTLAVRYHKPNLFSGRKRVKVPALTDETRQMSIERRPNVSPPLNIPICTFRYWEYIPDSHPVFKSKEYPQSQIDFDKVEALGFPSGMALERHPLPFVGPSLYNISNTPFPLRWSEFKRRYKEVTLEDGDDPDEA